MAINGIFTREFAQNSLEHKDGYPRGDKFRHIIGALHKVNTLAPNLHDELGGEAIFDIKMVTTDKLNRRSGLGTDLIRRSVELARSLGYKACKTEATGMSIGEIILARKYNHLFFFRAILSQSL